MQCVKVYSRRKTIVTIWTVVSKSQEGRVLLHYEWLGENDYAGRTTTVTIRIKIIRFTQEDRAL